MHQYRCVLTSVFMLLLCTGSARPDESDAQKNNVGSTSTSKSLVDPGVFERYLEKDHPQTFMQYGALAIWGPIQKLREETALHAVKLPKCGRVLWSELATKESSIDKWVVYADCETGLRVYKDWDGRTWSRKLSAWN